MHTVTEQTMPTWEPAYKSDIFVVDNITRHINTKQGTRYILQWNGHTIAKSTV